MSYADWAVLGVIGLVALLVLLSFARSSANDTHVDDPLGDLPIDWPIGDHCNPPTPPTGLREFRVVRRGAEKQQV